MKPTSQSCSLTLGMDTCYPAPPPPSSLLWRAGGTPALTLQSRDTHGAEACQVEIMPVAPTPQQAGASTVHRDPCLLFPSPHNHLFS